MMCRRETWLLEIGGFEGEVASASIMDRLYLPPTHTEAIHHCSTRAPHIASKILLDEDVFFVHFNLSLNDTNNYLFQLNITFNDKTEVFEYPSFEPVSPIHSPEEEPEVSARLKSNTPVGSSGI